MNRWRAPLETSITGNSLQARSRPFARQTWNLYCVHLVILLYNIFEKPLLTFMTCLSSIYTSSLSFLNYASFFFISPQKMGGNRPYAPHSSYSACPPSNYERFHALLLAHQRQTAISTFQGLKEEARYQNYGGWSHKLVLTVKFSRNGYIKAAVLATALFMIRA